MNKDNYDKAIRDIRGKIVALEEDINNKRYSITNFQRYLKELLKYKKEHDNGPKP